MLAAEGDGVIQAPDCNVPQQAQTSVCLLEYKIYIPVPSSMNADPSLTSLLQFHSSGISSYVYFSGFSSKPPCLAYQSHYSRHKIIPFSFKFKPPFEPPLLQPQPLPFCLPKHFNLFSSLHPHPVLISTAIKSGKTRQGRDKAQKKPSFCSVLGHSPSSDLKLQAKTTSDRIIHIMVESSGTVL